MGSGGLPGDIGWARWAHVTVLGLTLQSRSAVNLRRKGRTALLTRFHEEQETALDTEPRHGAAHAGAPVQPSGVFTEILLRSLEERLSDKELEELLRRAGETRSLAEFKETAASTSIEQFTRLRREADLVLRLGSNRRR